MRKVFAYIFITSNTLLQAAQIFYVTPNGAGNKDGSSWVNAYSDVQTAIDAAENANGGEVWIAAGTYKHGSSLTMKNNVAIYGGFAGTEHTKDERISGKNETCLDGENSYRVIYNNYTESNPLTNSAKLDSITIQNGKIEGNGEVGGGGMHNNYASPEIKNCIIRDNSSIAEYGGNGDFACGGGIYNSAGNPLIANCLFERNRAYSYDHLISSGGGGIYNTAKGNPSLINCIFNENGSGGNNGGGMLNASGNPTLENCTFYENSANYSGGGFFNESGTPILKNCTFNKNYAHYSGGGLFNGDYNPTLINCTFYQNSSTTGGGIANGKGSPSLINCTFYNNHASNCFEYVEPSGNGVWNAGSLRMINCIFWSNDESEQKEIFCDDSANPTIENCIIREGYNGTGTCSNIITTDPMLGELGDYGGNVQTIFVSANSSAIGTGKVVDTIDIDARGVTRNKTAPSIGAYEYQPFLIESQPESIELYSGNNAIISIVVNGDSVTYQWYKNGIPIEGATLPTLNLKNISLSDTGSYYCIISYGDVSIKSKIATINVIKSYNVYYVLPTGAGNKDGTSWGNAYDNIQNAIDAAEAMSEKISQTVEVWIGSGTYKHGSSLTMKNNVAIYGGFAGTETTKEQRIAGQNRTYLDGENRYRVFYNNYTESNPLTNSATLDNVTIQNGKVESEKDACGGGMYNNYARPEISNCTFTSNAVTTSYGCAYGGALYNETDCNPKIINCTFTENSATAIDSYASHAGGAGVAGGYNGNSTLINCSFYRNRIVGYNELGILFGNSTLINCTFSENTTTQGSATIHTGDELTLINCILWNNVSEGHKEISTYEQNNLTIDTCVIKGGYPENKTCKNIITQDPKLGTLGNYGGYVETIPVSNDSSAMGIGKVIEDVKTDARGIIRHSIMPTIGAYENLFEKSLIITKQPTSIDGFANGSYTLKAEARGLNLKYQWYKNGIAIEGANSANLNFEKIQLSDVGSYYCIISNDGGTDQTTTVTVKAKKAHSVYYVGRNGSDSNDGSSWGNAFSDVQTAINSAADSANFLSKSVEVWIATGTYKHGSSLTMKNNVAIYGGFSGTETAKDQRNAGQNRTYLDGENSYRVFHNEYAKSNPLTNTAKLDRITIQNGKIEGDGGGMYNYYADPEITNCTFRNNTASEGGAIYNYCSNSNITNCTFNNNTASNGGAIYNFSYSFKCTQTIVNCTFIENSSDSYGGAISNEFASPTLVNCTLVGNKATTGIGMRNYYSHPTIKNCIFWNSLTDNQIEISDTSSSPDFDTCIIQNGYNGNGIYENILTSDPLIWELDNYGGYVETIPILEGSSAAGKGTPIEGITTDARGFIRPSKPTIGASEYIIKKPVITTPIAPLTIFEDNDGYISIGGEGEFLSYQWYKDGVILQGETSSVLKLKKVNAANEGIYYCVIKNPAGSIQSNSAGVAVKPMPIITEQPTGFSIYSDKNGRLSVSATGENLSYQWYKDGVLIEGATSSTLEFEKIQTTNKGAYYCIVSNPAGSVKTDTVTIDVTQSYYVYYVTPTGASNKDGTSWENAYDNIQDAIDAAATMSEKISQTIEVWIGSGTYKHGSSLTMKNNVAIYGGFIGTETAKEQRIAGQNRTYLDGENSYRVFYNNYTESNPLTNSARLDNVTIQNGKVESEKDAVGGGMYNNYANPELTNCTFFNNKASSYAFIPLETPRSYGGGMYNNSSNPKLKNCTFNGNIASSSAYGREYYGPFSWGDFDCSAASYGGGIYNISSKPVFINCTFTKNSASASAISQESASAVACGGGIYSENGTPILINCTFSKNYASATSEYYEDPQEYGSENPDYTHQFYSDSGAIEGSSILTNCILWNNNNDYCHEISEVWASNISNCVIEGGYSGAESVITVDPKLGELGDYGGNVQTIPVFTGSSAIGAGKVVEDVDTDSRGVVRYGRAPTIGAYEFVVKDLPIITTQVNPLVVYQNNNGRLSISVVGDALFYQWYKDGVAIDGATSSTLDLENIQTTNAGSYYCIITNPAGSVKSNIVDVIVKPIPTIETQPKGFEIYSNNDGSLSVSATGNGLTYQWYKDGVAIDGATSSTLDLENIQTTNAGSYYCIITNPAGSVKSNIVDVIVKPIPTIETQPKGFEIYSNNDGSLSVSATGDGLTYQWYKDGVAIDGATSPTLDFENIQTTNAGSYYCVVTNPAGSVRSLPTNINVHQSADASSILNGLSIVRTVSTVGFARFTVETTAYNPTYEWYWGADSSGWTRFDGEFSNTLFIPAKSQYNRKNIKCKISNAGGYTETTAVLVYNSTAIQIVSQPQDVSCKYNDSFEFSVSATTSTGKISYQWQHSSDGKSWDNIEYATQSKYSSTIDNLGKCGYYRCEIDNGGGVLYSENAKLVCKIPIDIQPQDIAAFIGNEANVSLTISIPVDFSYQWQISSDGENWNNIEDATSMTYSFKMQSSLNGCKIRCLVSAVGIDDIISNTANITLLEDIKIIQQPKTTINAVRGLKATFSLEAKGYSPQYQWQVSYDFGETWENVIGAENPVYSLVATNEIVENVYRCLVWNDNCKNSPIESEIVWVENIIAPTPYQEWMLTNGLSGDNANALATPFNDGITNIEKFAFGLTGNKAASYSENALFKQSYSDGKANFQFPISKDAAGSVNVKIMTSEDLVNWVETPSSNVGESGDFNLMQTEQTVPEGGKLFFKLIVEEK